MGDNHGVSAYPLPPMQYVNLYSDENIRRNRDLPPPPPIQDSYMMFDAPFSADDTILRPLDSQPGLRRLYPQNCDHKRELKKLNHSILVNFLDLIDIMIKAPDSPKRQEKLDDLQLLFINMHHLINEFRPHQARETLRVMMERQMKQRLEIAEKFEKHLDKVKELLQTCIGSLPEDGYQDSKVLVKSELLTQESLATIKTEPESSACDTLDKMMCDIIDGMT